MTSNIDALDSNTKTTIEAAIDTLSNLVTIGKADTTTNFVAGDLTMYNAVDNGNPSISIGSSATERFSITANYDMNAQTLEKVTFATTASSTIADKGSMVFNIDGTDIATIDDGGISLADSKGLDVAGTAILSDSSGTMTLSNIDALDSTTKATIEATIFASDIGSTRTLTAYDASSNKVESGALQFCWFTRIKNYCYNNHSIRSNLLITIQQSKLELLLMKIKLLLR